MAPLTWRNVDSPSFASANQLYTLASELMNRGFNSASRGLDKFREITTDEQSARLMQDVMAAGNDPAAIQAAATRGNAAFLSPEALRFANAQPGVLLDRQQAEANIAQTGVRTNVLQYGLDRSRVIDGRDNAQYAARQEANPLLYQMQELARNGDLSGAQALAAQNADLLSRAGINADTVYNGISGGFTGGISDEQTGVRHDDFMRIAGNATNARELIDLAGRAFGTEAEARRGIQDLQAQGRISADLAQTALGSLGQAGLWTAPTAADEIMQRYGAPAMNGRGTTDPSWATGNTSSDWLSYTNQGATRNRPISSELQNALSFAPQMGLRVEVYSGGQPAAGEGGNRTGSVRHDHGGAADVRLYDVETGRMLDSSRPEDRARIEAFTEEAAARGVVGQGHGADYMGTNSFHVGFGTPAVWGAGGRGENAPDWYRAAYERGIRRGGGTPLSFGSNVPRAGTQPGASVYDQMMAAAAQDPDRTPLTFGERSWTPEGGIQPRVTDESPVSSIMAAASADPATSETARNMTPLVASPQAESDGGARANQMMAQVLAQPVEDVKPAQIVEAGMAGDNPLFTEVDGGVVARPPVSQQETLLIARAARAGILQTTPERATRQAEIDRVTQMMAEASEIAPNANRRFFQPGGMLGDIGMVAAQTGEAIVNEGAEILDMVNAPFRLLSEYALGRDYIGGTGRVDWNGDGYGQTTVPPTPGFTRDNLSPEQRAAMSGGDPVTNAMNAALSSIEGAGQRPNQTPGQGQQPAQTPTRPATVTSTDLASLLRTAQSTERVDRSLNPFAPMDELLAGENALSGDAASVAQQLTADGGKLSYLDTRTVRENIRELMRIPGVNSAAVAGALLAQNGVLYTGTEWNPLNWGSDDQLDAGRAAEIWQQYQRPDEEGRTGIEAGVARLNNRGRTETAVQGIAQVQADYEVLVAAMNQQIAQAPNQAQKDAIRQHFERNVFPLLYAQVQAIGASGALDRNANASTGR